MLSFPPFLLTKKTVMGGAAAGGRGMAEVPSCASDLWYDVVFTISFSA